LSSSCNVAALHEIYTLSLHDALPISDDTSGSGGESENKTYKVGIDTTYPPFEFEEGGEYTGIDIDIINAIAESQGFKIEFSPMEDRKSTRLNSSHVKISYAVFCLKKK